jgi:RNA polymerase sigma-70 factor (ECF subfamily)
MIRSSPIDVNLLNALKQGDENAFEVVFRRCYAKIYRFALATLYNKSSAEDITQNVFLSLWEHRKDIIPEKNFSAYLFTIAKNLVYRETEKMLLTFRYETHVKSHFCEEDYSSEEKIDAGSLEGLIIRLIEKLPEARRRIFLLRFTEDLINKDIAAKLSISEENVEKQVKRSLDYLRKYLKNYIAVMAVFCI